MSRYRAGTNNASFNKYNFGCGELDGSMLTLAMSKKPRNLEWPSMQRSDLVLKECVQLVILTIQTHYRLSAIVWLLWLSLIPGY